MPQKKSGTSLKIYVNLCIFSKDHEEVNKYIWEKPNSKNPDEKEPKIKYFRPASPENSELFWKDVNV